MTKAIKNFIVWKENTSDEFWFVDEFMIPSHQPVQLIRFQNVSACDDIFVSVFGFLLLLKLQNAFAQANNGLAWHVVLSTPPGNPKKSRSHSHHSERKSVWLLSKKKNYRFYLIAECLAKQQAVTDHFGAHPLDSFIKHLKLVKIFEMMSAGYCMTELTHFVFTFWVKNKKNPSDGHKQMNWH